MLNATRMIMGHTVQKDGHLSTRCGGRIVLIDIGISRGFGPFGGRCGVLEVSIDGQLEALYCPDVVHRVHRKAGQRFVRLPLDADPQSRLMHLFQSSSKGNLPTK